MPEGPTLIILKDLLQPFKHKKILKVEGNSKQPIEQLQGKFLQDVRTWGKQLLLCFSGFTLRIHFLLFGSYSINEPKENRAPRLSLHFNNGSIFIYAASVRFLTGDLDSLYPWQADIMSDQWNPARTRKLLKEQPELFICDALLTQELFAGSGNIIKNEVLFRRRLHPLNKVKDLTPKQLSALIMDVRTYSFLFLQWKQKFELRKHWCVHNKSICPRCLIPLKRAYLGKFNRRTFYCENCQILYHKDLK
ncbi:endonuclease-8 [Arachidicoccus rhizosphaerae]|uniref:Endonuclease-8 n=1 Tax=Arachidicoccus rhizosphaerae TaxID=551991 RepID=A0A1H3YYS3_9BACT|nr:DNA-formamidopyrimidine glycosylase family protein [Arachidicoccus rhizosphaerae]SEA16679.1 endonuclease-8 [Arachidicoccus rhizosphaerae]